MYIVAQWKMSKYQLVFVAKQVRDTEDRFSLVKAQ